MRELYINEFIIFELLDLEYGKIDTRIESVASVLNEKLLVTEIERHSHFLGHAQVTHK